MNLVTIPPALPFLDTLVARWLAATGEDPLGAAEGLILLPTRRAARGLTDAFLRATAGRPVLLPRIAALGGLDEAPLALAGALDLPPPVPPETRLALLARLVMALDGQYGAPATADRAWPLAAELAAALMDEAARAQVDLAASLPDAADPGFAEHWQHTLRFLEIVTRHWPEWLRDNEFSDVAQHQLALLTAQAEAWTRSPPPHRVWVAGTTGAIAAVANLLRVVARMPGGCVILPGLDLALPETAWEQLEESHPQAGMQRLLAGLGARREDVTSWGEPDRPDRAATLARALLPAAALEAWRGPADPALDGLQRLSPADQQEEALAIALILRNVLETPGARAALVTPDRDLAARVSGELTRFGVVADDSAGEKLAETPSAAFLRLLAHAVAERFAPVPLLSLLKHPFAALGLPPAACRAAARALERACLRGPRPPAGIAGLREALATSPAAAPADLLDRLETRLAPLLALAEASTTAPADWLAALAAGAEAVAATEAEPGAARLWSGEEGEALALHLAALREAAALLPAQPPATLPGFLDATLEGRSVRGRRALRRSGADAEHPRIFIWGLLEARLQSVDCVVLGGLAEGVWPATPEPGPWMSRPMRRRIGLPAPEERVGQMAHDFASIACAAPAAILSCPRRRDGAPAVPARWLVRLDAMLAGQGIALPEHPAVHWARALDQPVGPPKPARPPTPRPALELRPRRLSVTAIETWRRDPYAIYARHILRLRALAPIEEAAEAADYGSIVHAALHGFLAATGAAWPPDARARLRAAMERALAEARLRPALAAWWRPRLLRIADWVAEEEIRRRSEKPPAEIAAETKGQWELAGLPGGAFVLDGRADRIERRPDGSLAILDYKTGKSPKQQEVEAGYAPQLLLEALMAEAGAFPATQPGAVAELTYWELSGGFEPGRACPAVKQDLAGVLVYARDGLRDLIDRYDDPARPYLAQPHPDAAPRFSDYTQLARLAEWEAAGEGG